MDSREKGLRTILYLIGAGLLFLVLYAYGTSASTGSEPLVLLGNMSLLIGSSFLLAGASLLFGAVLGFLFGVPRTLDPEHLPIGSAPNPPNSPQIGDQDRPRYRANTNLEQISDWLTKILVGVGLTQFAIIPAQLQAVTSFFSLGISSSSTSSPTILAAIIYFMLCGFFLSYLWARLYFAGALREADIGQLADELRTQANRDAAADSLVYRQLSPSADAPAPTQRELNEAIKLASPSARTMFFNRAQHAREENIANNDKDVMEVAIPIFEALIEADTNGTDHRSHANLGYALKDQRIPDIDRADSELTRAIEIRNKVGDKNQEIYEFNRATCRILLCKELGTTSPADRERILGDLRVAARNQVLRDEFKEGEVGNWLEQNKVTEDDLRSGPR